jgi:hypothetical protein
VERIWLFYLPVNHKRSAVVTALGLEILERSRCSEDEGQKMKHCLIKGCLPKVHIVGRSCDHRRTIVLRYSFPHFKS